MKPEIHPSYHKNAKIRCACGNAFTAGSTKEKIEVEICAKCHPFFTGEEKLIDTAGRVEKFKTRLRAAETRSGPLRRNFPPEARLANGGSEASEAKARRAKANAPSLKKPANTHKKL